MDKMTDKNNDSGQDQFNVNTTNSEDDCSEKKPCRLADYELTRRIVLEDLKHDLFEWGKRRITWSAGGIIISVIVFIGAFGILLDMVKSIIDSSISRSDALLDKTEQIHRDTTRSNNELGREFKALESKLNEYKVLESKLDEYKAEIKEYEKEMQDINAELAIKTRYFEERKNELTFQLGEQITSIRRIIEKDFAKYTSNFISLTDFESVMPESGESDNETINKLANQIKIKNSLPPLITPISLNPENPTVIFSPIVSLEWELPRSASGKTLEFQVRWESEHVDNGKVKNANTNHTLYKLKMRDEESGSYNAHGRVKWDVRVISDTQNNLNIDWRKEGIFDFYEDSWDRIQSTKAVRVGFSTSYIGDFSKIDNKTKEYQGFDFELARLIIEDISDKEKYEIKYIGYAWENLLSKPQTSEIDFVVGAISIKEDREHRFGLKFSKPYFQTEQIAIVRKYSGILNKEQLKERSIPIAVQAGTTSVSLARSVTDKVISQPSTTAAMVEFANGRVEAVITDELFAAAAIEEHGLKEKVETITLGASEYYGIAVAEGQSRLLEHINNSIKKSCEENRLKNLEKEWLAKKNRELKYSGVKDCHEWFSRPSEKQQE